MADEEDFEDQLEQEKQAKVEEEDRESAKRGLTYTDTDGTVMEWDPAKRAYFPQIDSDFIARYQMSYGVDTSQADGDPTSAGADGTAAESTASSAQAWQDYYQHYNQQGGAKKAADAPKAGDDPNADQQQYSNADWHSYYAYYYGEDYAKTWLDAKLESDAKEDEEDAKEAEEDAKKKAAVEEEEDMEEEEEKNGKGKKKTKAKGKEAEKRKAPDEPPKWFDHDAGKSAHVYVSNLPSDLTEEEYQELMNKCGLIMFDPHTHKPKLKLYRNADGTLKGDGLCCYIKQESVELALNILDGSNVKGSIISVERAKFEMKGSFDPNKKKKKLSNKAKRKMKENQAKLFDWRPDKPAVASRMKYERIVILKNMFDIKEFEEDPSLINELREDVRDECSKSGDVRKVQVHDRHTAGVISVTMRTPEEADACVAALNARWFAKRQIQAETYDGKTKYNVNETEAEKEERLQGWEAFLDDDNSKTGAKQKTDVEDSKLDSSSSTSGDKSLVQGEKASRTSAADERGSAPPPSSGAAGASSEGTEGGHSDAGGRETPAQPQVSHDSEGGAAN